MSDEHKRQAEYHALAAEAAGVTADLEVVTTGKTRVDVVIGDRIGIEVQRSDLNLNAAVSRTKRSMAAGLDMVGWFTDRPARPVWYGKVPSYATRVRGWDEMPRLGTVGAIGPQVIEAARCVYGNFEKCPRGKRSPCGEYHEKVRPWPMMIDDLVARLAEGEIVPALTGKYVRLVSPSSLRLYEELTGKSALYGGAAPVLRAGPGERVECERPTRPGWFARPGDCAQLELQYEYGQPSRPVAIRPVNWRPEPRARCLVTTVGREGCRCITCYHELQPLSADDRKGHMTSGADQIHQTGVLHLRSNRVPAIVGTPHIHRPVDLRG
jgi:hypothetical protein